MPGIQIILGDCRETLSTLAPDSVQCCVTSPPYWGLRDYGHEAQLGSEPTYQQYISNMESVFAQVYRVLRPDGTLWLNLGDCYATGAGKACSPGGGKQGERFMQSSPSGYRGAHDTQPKNENANLPSFQPNRMPQEGLKPKDLVGIPWRVAFALQAAGWYLRRDVVWGKPNGMPESVEDRPCSSHEYVFMLTKSERYFYDYEAVRLPALPSSVKRLEQHVEMQMGSDRANAGAKTNGAMKAVSRQSDKQAGHSRRHDGFNDRWDEMERQEKEHGAALRSVWWISPAQTKDAHFAVMPANLAATCILASSKPGDVILDPFGGSGTTGMVALQLGRSAILCELNPEYAKLAESRTSTTPGMGF